MIEITDLHGGINVKDDPGKLATNEVVECVGFDLTIGGRLESAKGLSAHDLGTLVPSGVDISWIQVLFMQGNRYVLCTTATSLYANGVLIDSSFGGRFKALVHGDQIYMVNGSLARRFNGNDCYQWGITRPSSMPTITIGANSTRDLEDFESPLDWTTHDSGCTVTEESSIIFEGLHSVKFAVNASTRGYSYKVFDNEIDCTKFSDNSDSTDADLIQMMIYVDNMTNFREARLIIDISPLGDFATDFYVYSLPFSGADNLRFLAGSGAPSVVSQVETTTEPDVVVNYYSTLYQYGAQGEIISDSQTYLSSSDTSSPGSTVHKITTYSPSGEVLSEQTVDTGIPTPTPTPGVGAANLGTAPQTGASLTFWSSTPLSEFGSGRWCKLSVPKSYFIRQGVADRDWSNVKAVKLEVEATSSGAVNVYFDQLRMIGGGNLNGVFWFAYGWGRGDSTDFVRHYSAPVKNSDGSLYISGPHAIERQPVEFGTRTASSDSQVNRCVFYVLGGGLTDWWQLHVVNNNLTTGGTITKGEDDVFQRMICLNNDPAPSGTDILEFNNRIWMTGFGGLLDTIACSDISKQGDVVVEAWPYKNAYQLGNFGRRLLSMKELGNRPVVRGEEGEWFFGLTDPGDFSSFQANKISPKGLLAQDGVLDFGNFHIFPTSGAFVASDGGVTKIVASGASAVIGKGNMETAQAVVSGLDGYLTFQLPSGSYRTAKIDLMSGAPRVAYQYQFRLDCIFYETNTNSIYAVKDGVVYLFNEGYSGGNGDQLYLDLQSREYNYGREVIWDSITFRHNTNGEMIVLRVYVDGLEVGRKTLTSTRNVSDYFNFGPRLGSVFKFRIDGYYESQVKIYLPMRIYCYGPAAASSR